MLPEKLSYNFNSIKVQLKLDEVTGAANKQGFQFHKGTIKTSWSNATEYRSVISIP